MNSNLKIFAGAFSVGLFLNAATVIANETESHQRSSESNINFSSGSGVVTGRVYEDKNGNLRRDRGERGQANVVVYIDSNNNAQLDPEERFTTTGRRGRYVFFDVPAGEQTIRQEVPFGFSDTALSQDTDGSASLPITVQIIGGDVVSENEYPFMAAVGNAFGGNFFQFCGGALLTSRWVVTAAHCSEAFDFDDEGNPVPVPIDTSTLGVLVGTNDVRDGSGTLLEVDQVILHPDYKQLPDDLDFSLPFGTTAGYDIALWRLKNPVTLEEGKIETVSMLDQSDTLLAEDGVLATTVGWGVSDLSSFDLQDVHLPIADTANCEVVYDEVFGVESFDTQICAGIPLGGIDACQGDSGGPLLVRDFAEAQWRIAGLTSYGLGCAEPGFPGVWSRVSVLSEWARNNAGELSSAQTVNVRPRRVTRANFGNTSSTFEIAREISPRWQLANLSSNRNELGTDYSWNIIDEANTSREFNCAVDPDGLGPLTEESIACSVGDTSYQYLHSPFENGIFFNAFTASDENATFERQTIDIIGIPPTTNTRGELVDTDSADPDYLPDVYFIDYFDIADIDLTKPIGVSVTAENEAFFPFVVIYDRDQREADGFGGELIFLDPTDNPFNVETLFVPEMGVNYLVGVSTFGIEGTGNYTVSVINSGEAIATTLSIDWQTDVSRINQFDRRMRQQRARQLEKILNYPGDISEFKMK